MIAAFRALGVLLYTNSINKFASEEDVNCTETYCADIAHHCKQFLQQKRSHFSDTDLFACEIWEAACVCLVLVAIYSDRNARTAVKVIFVLAAAG